MTDPATILIVDDEPSIRFTLRVILEDEGFVVCEAEDGESALDQLEGCAIDLVISDLKMPGIDGLQLLEQIRELGHPAQTIMITAHGSERHAIDAMRLGAADYFTKPFDPNDIVRVVRSCTEKVRLANENRTLRSQLSLSRHMVFVSDAMKTVGALVDRVASRDVTVLVTGETGTGKELVARALSEASGRTPFVTFNCAALPNELAKAELFGHQKGAFTGADRDRKGLFRQANGGTLLLDEIGELDLEIQAALLRVIQEREVRPVGSDTSVDIDIRLIATTHRDLKKMSDDGSFRHDLLYRLDVVTIALPPLRDRRDDIRPLAQTFATRAGDRFGLGAVSLSERTVRALESLPFPGNVRELQHIVERLVAMSDSAIIDAPNPVGNAIEEEPLSLADRVAKFERELIAATLAQCENNQSEAARRLKINRSTLIDKLTKHGLR